MRYLGPLFVLLVMLGPWALIVTLAPMDRPAPSQIVMAVLPPCGPMPWGWIPPPGPDGGPSCQP
jgi:hypothetical protein